MKKVLLLLLLILRQQYALEREAQAIRAQKIPPPFPFLSTHILQPWP